MKKLPSKMGSPTIRTDQMIDEIMERIVNGEAVTTICDDPKMPDRSTFFVWVSTDSDLSYRYTQALNNRTHLKAEARHLVVEQAISDLANLPAGVNANVFGQLIKEKIRAIEWDAERLAPKRYKYIEKDETTPQKIQIEFTQAIKNDKNTTN